MKSSPFVTANFLEHIAEPASRFHSNYLAYRKGEITCTELIARLPHIAMLGDSVCMDIYISSAWSTFWRAHTCRARNWFLDADPASGVRSISKRLEEFAPFVAMEYAGLGALVDHERGRQKLFRRILGTRNFSGQVSQLLRSRHFPDLVLISIGHNNVDWAWRCPPDDLVAPEQRLNRLSKHFRQNYARELRRLLGRAYATLTWVYRQKGAWDIVDELYESQINLEPKSAWAKGNFAQYLIWRGQPDRAIGRQPDARDDRQGP